MLSGGHARFVSFAFCRADILLEIDNSNVIAFAAGATGVCFDKAPETLVGTSFLELLPSEDRQAIQEMIDAGRRRGKIDDLVLWLSGSRKRELHAAISGHMVPEYGDHFFLGIKIAPPQP
ncbi:MAG: PAS domain-containing protein [Alphaproteobacteria bacterium]